MLYEIKRARQVPGEGFRRWFTDADHDLVVWYPQRGSQEIVGFQFAYDKQTNEHALTWTRERGFEHHRIDAGEKPGQFNASPILVADGLPDPGRLAERFKQVATNLDAGLYQFIVDKLASYRR
jgi:hypothetical protein